MDARVELQAEIDATREVVFALVSTGDGLSRWLDSASIETRPGGAVRLRLLEAEVAGKVVALDPPQHISFTWDYPAEPLASPSVVAFDAISHGHRTHLTLRHVGLAGGRARDDHEALWRFWFPRLVEAASASRVLAAPAS
ncbi:MAG TPA: SRPBCC domain-containing protein [Candidatus Saccharimonadia bacterium]|nr:SRPBCC domain-containing protein [Candidatus Saccharimonadia bacterium]